MKFKGKKQKKELAAVIDRGRKLRAAGQDEEASEFLKEAVQRFPDDPELRLLHATMLLESRPEAVASEAAKAIELGPDDPVVLVRAGHLMLDRGEVEAARSCAIRASELAQPGFALMSGLETLNGLLAARDGEDDLAEEQLRSAVARDPVYSSFAVNLVRFLVARDRQAEAIEVIDGALIHAKQKDDLQALRAEIAGDE